MPLTSPSVTPKTGPSGKWVLPVGLLMATIHFAAGFSGQVVFEPLPWDMSHHYLGGQAFQQALATGSLATMVDQLRATDLYPPGHSLWLGLWLQLTRTSPVSGVLFQLSTLWACILGLWVCSHRVFNDHRARV